MAKNIQRLAELMGAKIVGQIPDTGGGAFGAARLGHLYQQRMAELRAQEQAEEMRCAAIPISAATERKLAELAQRLSTSEAKVEPLQLAGHLLAEAVDNYGKAG